MSPSAFNLSETVSTLRFGASTSKIKNKPKRHEVQGVKQLKTLLAECQKGILKNQATLSRMKDEMQTFSDFFKLIRMSGLVLDDDAHPSEVSLTEFERVDVRRPGRMKQKGNAANRDSNELKCESSESESSDTASVEVSPATGTKTMLRTASAGELRASLRAESQSYVETHEDDHVAQAKAALSWEELDDIPDETLGPLV